MDVLLGKETPKPGDEDGPPAAHFQRHRCSTFQTIGCTNCGWPIRGGEDFCLVVADDEVSFYCEDHERCSRQAGK